MRTASGARAGRGWLRRPAAVLVVLALAAALLPGGFAPDVAAADDGIDPADDDRVRSYVDGEDGGDDADVATAGTDDVDDEADALEPVEVDDDFFNLQWYLRETRTTRAWRLTMGDPNITVAVVDTGVDPDHRDFDGAFWSHPQTGAAGRDLLNDDDGIYVGSREDWHGTAVAGVTVARADDGYGIAGVAPNASLMVLRVYESSSPSSAPALESGYDSAIEAIDLAVDYGADVILLTWGGQDDSDELRQAIARAQVPVVAAAGNDGVDLSDDGSTPDRFPAMYSLANLVTVTASNLDGGLWSDSDLGEGNVGAQHVDLAAPGELIAAPSAGGGHNYYAGTSFAAPQVAGALALAVGLAPHRDAGELIAELLRTARQSEPFAGQVTSGGILDVAGFLTAVSRPRCAVEPPPAGFVDVSPDGSHTAGIDCITWWGLAEGIGDDRYAPGREVTRGQMATFLTRVLAVADALPDPDDLPDADDPEQASFTDTAGTTHAEAIEVVAELELAMGRDDGSFRPNAPVSRAQMAAFLERLVSYLTGPVPSTDRVWFDDVEGITHEDAIMAVRELGITIGTVEPRIFEPRRDVSRAQMASFLARSLDALERRGAELTPPQTDDATAD